jgi:hypothetical protein
MTIHTYPMNTQLKETAIHLIDDLRDRHAARVAHRHLRAELATYTTASEISDLLAAVTRFGADEGDEVRQILEQNLAARQRSSQLAS